MATEPKPFLSEDLMHQIDQVACEQNREPAEVLGEAWKRYVEGQSWVKLVTQGLENARRLGLKESDTDRLIAEYRREKRRR